jgi:hypothetical protein
MKERKRIRLDDLERKHPFVAPEGYFEGLAQAIQERISEETDSKVVPIHRKGTIFQRRWTLPAVAASLALIAGLVWFTLPVRQGPLGPDALSSVSDIAILDYLEFQELDYDDLASQDVIQKAFLDESTIIQYLNGVDDETIREQLRENSIYDDII